MYVVNPQRFGYQVAIHNSCTCNELVSLHNRHLIDRTLREYCKDYMLGKFKEVSGGWAIPSERMSYDEVIRCYRGAKKRMYTFAKLELVKYGLRSSDANVRMFVKFDKYDAEEIATKAPRAIQYRHARYNLVLASYLKSFEAKFYQLPSKNGLRVITKGLNPVEVAGLLLEKSRLFDEPVYLSCDHSKFDSSVNVDHLKFEHGIYNKVFKDTQLKFLLKKQLYNKGFSRNGIRYSVLGTRMSGDYNTGLGNCLLNRAVLESMLIGLKHEIMLDGDDSIVIVERRDLRKVDLDHFRRCGFTTEVTQTEDISEVTYCKRRLCHSNPPMMVRNPIRAMSNMAVTAYNYGALGFKYWALGALECERLSNPGIPIFRKFPVAKRIIRDSDYHRKLENVCDTVECSEVALSTCWNLSIDTIRMVERDMKYLGWNCDNRIQDAIKHLKGQVNQNNIIHESSHALSTQQASLSGRFCALHASASECWDEIGSPNCGTTSIYGSTSKPGEPSNTTL
uniref:RNA-directed RNA polymerase n=1 Tax=Riboviria sp. TaxID=2585031 RepID=A0A6M3YNJ8_9VIRU|nr:MAG: hypothetical protein 2 [Riboviria sp.]